MNRVIPLQGGRNFRDLGGYTTVDGRRVLWERLYRSGVMSYLTDQDHACLRPLDIRVVCDLRTLRERQREPIRWCSTDVINMQWDDDQHDGVVWDLLRSTDFPAWRAKAAMITLYRNIPSRFEKKYSQLFSCLAAGRLPLVFGCSAGKDRTGVAAGLILTILGVPRDQVMADFALTDRVVDLEQVLINVSNGGIGLGQDRLLLLRASKEAREPLLRADPEYLEAAFDQVEADHGSIEAYAQKRLGMTGQMLSNIRNHLLEG